MEKMKISVVTVCYNAVNDIEKTMLSVVNQTYNNIEYIVIDGVSSDGTIDIIKKYSNKIASFISEPDKGIYDAMNKGIKMATGDYVNFMNAGDVFYDNKVIERIIPLFDVSKSVEFGDISIFKESQMYISKANIDNLYKGKKFSMGFNHQASFVKTEVAKMYLFDLKYKYAADYNMMTLLYKNGHEFHYLNTPIAQYDLTGASSLLHVKEHRLECLNILSPNTLIKNRIIAQLEWWKVVTKSYIVKLFRKLSPSILDSYYSKKRNWEKN